LNIASKLFGDTKDTENPIRQKEVDRLPIAKLSGFHVCSQHIELPPMTVAEFDVHKTAHDVANDTRKTLNNQMGLIGLWKNAKIRQCEAVSIPEGDLRLKLVPAVSNPQGHTVTKEVIREVVLVTCRHCGARSHQGTLKCPTCGADL